MIVDTSVWIDFLRGTDSRLEDWLENKTVLTHPFIIGELACGRVESQTLNDLLLLPRVEAVSIDNLLTFVAEKELAGRGLGFVDTALLAACEAHSTSIVTADRRLREAAEELGYLAPV